MKWIWLLLLCSIVVCEARGQTIQPIRVGVHATSSVTWDYAPGPAGGEPVVTYARCGTIRGGIKPIEERVEMPAQEIRFNVLFPVPGKYFCTFTGKNLVEEGESSDEIPFESREGVPPKVINIRVIRK
jgi:hypothetical protein